jgi:hypothetical protein
MPEGRERAKAVERAPSAAGMNSLLAQPVPEASTVPTPGDSGAWVLTDDQPPEWAGVFFGEDGKRGFCLRARWVHEWAQKTTSAILMH